MKCLFPRPFFVTPHAVNRYRERVRHRASAARAIEEIQRALQRPEFVGLGRDGAAVCGCKIGNLRFCAVVMPPRTSDDWPVVLAVGEWWRWHEFRRLWREEKVRCE